MTNNKDRLKFKTDFRWCFRWYFCNL